jgi:ABC-type branched-subunit amino acid transport system substrate-binding protein
MINKPRPLALTSLAVVVLILFSTVLPAATDAEKQFQQALESYQAGEYGEAASAFHDLAFADRQHPWITASLLMWARSLLKQDYYDQALDAASQLIHRFPSSSYLDDAHYLRAEAFFNLKEHLNCAHELVLALDNTADQHLQERARNHLKALSQSALSQRQRRDLSRRAKLTSTKRILLGLEAAGLSEQGIVVGAVLPLTGPNSQLGTALKTGLEFAFSRWREQSNVTVFLTIQDSRSSPYRAAHITRDLLDLEEASIILCAGDEGVVTTCASLAVTEQIPCLILNPQTYSLPALGESVFQLYPDRRTEGESLARYAVESLGLRTFAVLSSATDPAREMAEGFVQTVDNHGGEILIHEWFYPGALDFKKQFTQVRERGWGIMEAAKPDTQEVPSEEQEAEEDSIWAYLTNGEILNIEEMDAEDSLEIPIEAFDGFLIIPDTSDVNVLAPQYVYYNFDARLIGSHDWDYKDTFQKNRNYLSGIVFSSDLFWDVKYSYEDKWISDFRIATGITPERWHIMGYDGMSWALAAVQHAQDNPKQLLQRLNNQSQYQGIGGLYTFRERTNVSVPIVTYQKGRKRLLHP